MFVKCTTTRLRAFQLLVMIQKWGAYRQDDKTLSHFQRGQLLLAASCDAVSIHLCLLQLRLDREQLLLGVCGPALCLVRFRLFKLQDKRTSSSMVISFETGCACELCVILITLCVARRGGRCMCCPKHPGTDVSNLKNLHCRDYMTLRVSTLPILTVRACSHLCKY